MPPYDHLRLGMTPPESRHLFPHARFGNQWQADWPCVRSSVQLFRRYDTCHAASVAVKASSEEAACLYMFESQFAGQHGLEIETCFGWTAAHVSTAGARLCRVHTSREHSQRKRTWPQCSTQYSERAAVASGANTHSNASKMSAIDPKTLGSLPSSTASMMARHQKKTQLQFRPISCKTRG